MKLSDLIKQLQDLQTKHGDLPVKVQTLSHSWPPEPVARPIGGEPEFILLNP